MNFHPILFRTPMVQGIYADIKDLTRRLPTCKNSLVDGRIVSPKQWKYYDFNFDEAYVDPGPSPAGNAGPYLKVPSKTLGSIHRVYPLYQLGDVLWVKETYQLTDASISYKPGYVYKATDPDWSTMDGWKWKPSIFMPKDGCRLFLQVISVWPERLCDISEEDAIREGIEEHINKNFPNLSFRYRDYLMDGKLRTAKGSFMSLWQSINGPESWDANPWIWRVEFKRIDKPKNF